MRDRLWIAMGTASPAAVRNYRRNWERSAFPARLTAMWVKSWFLGLSRTRFSHKAEMSRGLLKDQRRFIPVNCFHWTSLLKSWDSSQTNTRSPASWGQTLSLTALLARVTGNHQRRLACGPDQPQPIRTRNTSAPESDCFHAVRDLEMFGEYHLKNNSVTDICKADNRCVCVR